MDLTTLSSKLPTEEKVVEGSDKRKRVYRELC